MSDKSEDKLALVTGAAGGIGQAIVLELAKAGWAIAANDLETSSAFQAQLDATRSVAAAPTPSSIHAVFADVGNEAAVEAMFQQVHKIFGRYPDLLINNAAVQTWKPLLELDIADWQRTISTNLTGCFLTICSFARHRSSTGQGGVIINIGSGCNALAFPNLVDYTASKGGVEMLTKSAALELGPLGIRVNCLAPGAIETERTQQEAADYAASWSAKTPLGRIGRPADVAAAVMLLASERAAFITGQTINVDGGLFSRAIWPEQY
ncbi:MAG: SDR family oxidoreductase [Granulosicoccus sp.]|nr:SDR family oxidoreductase [Granulosicoccus sp.]